MKSTQETNEHPHGGCPKTVLFRQDRTAEAIKFRSVRALLHHSSVSRLDADLWSSTGEHKAIEVMLEVVICPLLTYCDLTVLPAAALPPSSYL